MTEPSITDQSAEYFGKRVFDLLAAVVLLVLFAPLLLAIAVLVRLTSRGSVLFRQTRLGHFSQPFSIFKFRSMRVDADKTGPAFTEANDSRITTIGRIIRRTSLDELPQLLNVLRGDMSLVGPRPYIGFELAEWSAEDRSTRARVRPGITGLSQVMGRSSLTPQQSRDYDLQYVRECGFLKDCKILLQTIASVLLRRGVN